jgi:hypothetical protein
MRLSGMWEHLMNHWQKVSIDWPCAAGDWLWLNLVLMPLRTLSSIKRRQLLRIVAVVFLLIFLQQVIVMDLTFLFGIDLGLVMEVSAAIFVLSLREHIKVATNHVRSVVTRRLGRIRPRIRQIVTRAVRGLLPPTSDDDGGALAFA